ncbi:hypothetical protein K5E_21300 [Enterococcus thailandicus]|nr:hypothetical protein [Enterococcus thailandicus]GMC02827.1 hypothetical protein K4E_03400 [Enterococcus thailandicus]GMC09991.1 hypothetical protein K5E_21300 [Enterococcus thailandicus]
MKKKQMIGSRSAVKSDARKVLLNITFALGFVLLIGIFTELTFHLF